MGVFFAAAVAVKSPYSRKRVESGTSPQKKKKKKKLLFPLPLSGMAAISVTDRLLPRSGGRADGSNRMACGGARLVAPA